MRFNENVLDTESSEPRMNNKKDLGDEEHVHLTWRSWLVVLVTCFAQLAQVFVVVAAGQVTAFVSRDLGDAALSGWIIQGPLLMQAVLSPIVGRLSDVFNRKWLVSIPPLIACIGAIVSATAESMTTLIGGAILIGVTLSTIAIIQAIPSEILPLKYRAVANAAGFLGSAFGGIVGGLSTGSVTNMSSSGWRNVFWIQAALHGATCLGLVLLYHPPRKSDYPKLSLKQYLWAVDPIGSGLFMTGATLTLLAFDWLGGSYSASDAHFIAPLTIGLAGLLAFALYEWKSRSDGLAAHILFRKSSNFALGIFALTIEGWIFYSAVNSVVPQLILNLGFENNAWSISIRQLSSQIPTIVACVVVTWYATRFRDVKTPLLVTLTIFLASTICYALITPKLSAAQLGYNVLVSVGQAGPLTLLVAVIQFSAPHENLSTATGLAFSARALGGVFGSAVLNTIITRKLRSSYAKDVGNAAVSAGLPESSVATLLEALQTGDMQALETLPGVNQPVLRAAINASHWAYAHAYRLAWWSTVPFIVLAMVAVACMRDVKELMTERVEASVEPSARIDEKDTSRVG